MVATAGGAFTFKIYMYIYICLLGQCAKPIWFFCFLTTSVEIKADSLENYCKCLLAFFAKVLEGFCGVYLFRLPEYNK